jgi:hypothetical protein
LEEEVLAVETLPGGRMCSDSKTFRREKIEDAITLLR